jgi:DNA-binding IscR family transcriptional regulator
MEKYSDSVLAVKIQDWIEEHNGEINLSEFSSVHGVSEARVEQVLNNLISEGYLESRK